MKPKEITNILNAFNDSKTIEILVEDKEWEEVYDFEKVLAYLANGNVARIKKSPQYVPYESIQEFLKDCKEHGPYLKRIVSKESSYQTYVLPLSIRGAWIDFNSAVDSDLNSESECTYTHLLNRYKWQDGTPCGMLKF